MRILIVSLYSGENEFSDSVKSVDFQTFKDWKHVVFKNLPNKEAHEKLYNYFMESQSAYDLFIKLDADMVFTNKFALHKIIRIFEAEENLDHLILGVKDWYSSLPIEGLHIFSNRTTWLKSSELLNVDTQPNFPGKRIKLVHTHDPIAYHSPNPSINQAYQFGVHRTLKTFRFIDKGMINLGQWNLIVKSWKNFKEFRDIRHGYVVLGAENVLKHYRSGKVGEYKSLRPELEITINDLFSYLNPTWRTAIHRELKLLYYAGYKRILAYYYALLLKKLHLN